MVGKFWTTGVTLQYICDRWHISLEFTDDGFCDDEAVDGSLCVRYWVTEIQPALSMLIKDAERLGIEFKKRHLYAYGDGESKDYPMPAGWRDMFKKLVAEMGNGWESAYYYDNLWDHLPPRPRW